MELNPSNETILKLFGSRAAYFGPRPSKCACKGSGVIPPYHGKERPNDGVLRFGCPHHRALNEWWPQAQGDGTTKFIQTRKNGRDIWK